MALPPHLEGKTFADNPQNINRNGRPVGSKNRSTILREIADTVINGTSIDDKPVAGTAEEFAMMALMRKAIEGDIQAIKELNDTLYGKITEKKEVEMAVNRNDDLTTKVLSKIPTEELEDILNADNE